LTPYNSKCKIKEIITFGGNMPRRSRVTNETDTYHIMSRGIDRQLLFEDRKDFMKYKEILAKYVRECGIVLYAYCLMDNHVHLAVKVSEVPLHMFVKKLNVSYVQYFNYKYQRSGPLFQDRYRCELILSDTQLIRTIRYIHANPVKAGLCRSPEEYDHSSYSEFLFNSADNLAGFDNVSKMFSSIMEFEDFSRQNDDRNYLDISNTERINDRNALLMIKDRYPDLEPRSIIRLNKSERNAFIMDMRSLGLSINQICRITGLTKGIVAKVRKG